MSFVDKDREGSPSKKWSGKSPQEKRTDYDAHCQLTGESITYLEFDAKEMAFEKQQGNP